MTIVLDEREWAAEMIADHNLGKKPYETLVRIAKYYLSEHYSTRDTKNKLNSFLSQCDSDISLPLWADTIDKAVKKASKNNIIKIESIDITSPEIETIESLKQKQLQRLAFTLLCVSKYWDRVNDKNNHWVNNKDSEIMKMANINTSVKRQCSLYHELWTRELIQFSTKVDNTNVKVVFGKDGDISLKISDFRNLGNQYMRYEGGDYFECCNCGAVTRVRNSGTGRPQKYCDKCSKEVASRKQYESLIKRRGAGNQSVFVTVQKNYAP